MRSVAVCGDEVRQLHPLNDSFAVVPVHNVPATFAMLELPDPPWKPDDPDNKRRVLVRVRAFSCNFRDRAQIVKVARTRPHHRFYVIGSEFAGQVVAVGPEVTRVRVGDRVMGDNSWPNLEPEGWRRGVPTNHASREYLVLREEKLARIPDRMPDEMAAAFSIGAQTAYAMVARLDLCEGSHVLVTAARSVTSQFTIAALRRHGLAVHAVTSSDPPPQRLRELGVERIYQVERGTADFLAYDEIALAAEALDGFDAVVDPFFDLHLRRVLPVLARGGCYITCGFFTQSQDDLCRVPATDFLEVMQIAMLRNVQLMGHCTGSTVDLQRALIDYEAGHIPVPLDSVFRAGDLRAYIERSFTSRERCGKAVYAYG